MNRSSEETETAASLWTCIDYETVVVTSIYFITTHANCPFLNLPCDDDVCGCFEAESVEYDGKMSRRQPWVNLLRFDSCCRASVCIASTFSICCNVCGNKLYINILWSCVLVKWVEAVMSVYVSTTLSSTAPILMDNHQDEINHFLYQTLASERLILLLMLQFLLLTDSLTLLIFNPSSVYMNKSLYLCNKCITSSCLCACVYVYLR